MSFFAKAKKFFGIGAPKLTITSASPHPYKKNYNVSGFFKITCTDACRIKSMKAYFREEIKSGRGGDRTSTSKTYSKTPNFGLNGRDGLIDFPLELEAGEYECSFHLPPFNPEVPLSEQKNSVLSGIGKLGNMASNEQRKYFIKVEANVEGIALDPSASLDYSVDFSTWQEE